MTKQSSIRSFLWLLLVTASFWFVGCTSNSDSEGNSNGNLDRTWSVYKADETSSSYSPLDQINTSNVSQLQPAWTFYDK